MNNIVLYALTVMIWGTTWFAVRLQVDLAPFEISILYRAILSAVLLLSWCKYQKISLLFRPKDHVFLVALGVSMFSIHYLFVFNAYLYLISGVVSVVFSGVSFLSILNNYIFFRTKPSLNVILGALIGVSGLCVFFWDEVANVALHDATLKGLSLAGIGALIFSLGGSITRRNHSKGLQAIPSLTVGMVYGTLIMLVYTVVQSTPFVIPSSTPYWMSMFYLAIAGSVAFICYMKLIQNMGPELAGYTAVLVPVVALLVSSVLEGYEGSLYDFLGLTCVIVGNILVMRKKPFRDLFARAEK